MCTGEFKMGRNCLQVYNGKNYKGRKLPCTQYSEYITKTVMFLETLTSSSLCQEKVSPSIVQTVLYLNNFILHVPAGSVILLVLYLRMDDQEDYVVEIDPSR